MVRGVPVRLYRVNAKGKITKDRSLDDVESLLVVEELKLGYDDYISSMVIWATEDPVRIAKELGVLRMVPMGGYIRGLLGGERKRGKREYAGLVVEYYKVVNGIAHIKLCNLTKSYQVPVDLMERYGVGIYKLYYRGLINPYNCRTYDVLLSARGDEELRRFLKALIELNRGIMPERDLDYLHTLIEELKVSVDMFKEEHYYVVYRRNRAFTACVVERPKNAVSSDVVSYIECRDAEQAYYYAAVLNYLAYKVVESGRSFIRDQFARPAIAIVVAGLSWKTVPETTRTQIASLSMQLSRRLVWKDYRSQRTALIELVQYPEFKKIMGILDELVDKDKLREALELVSASDKENTEEDSD